MLARLVAHRFLVVVVAGYYTAALAAGAMSGNSETVSYAVLLPLLVGIVAYFDARRPFSRPVLWGLALWGGLHMVGGLVSVSGGRVLYNVWLLPFVRFDQMVHAVGFAFAGLAFREAVVAEGAAPSSGAALALMGALGIGAANETVEFLVSRVREDTNIGGFENTGWDLVANTVGAVAASVWVRYGRRSRPRAR